LDDSNPKRFENEVTKKSKYLKMPNIIKFKTIFIIMMDLLEKIGLDVCLALSIRMPLAQEQKLVNAINIRNRQSHHP
jgi:hypothetical protein